MFDNDSMAYSVWQWHDNESANSAAARIVCGSISGKAADIQRK